MAKECKVNPNTPRKCLDCGRLMKGRTQVYHYTECGLSSVKLSNIVVYECECGTRVPVIPAIQQLHFAIAINILRKQTLLAAEEIRFLRKMGGMSQKELAGLMGVHPTRPCKWETGTDPIGGESDRFFRSLCFIKMLKQVIGREQDDLVDGFAADSEEIKKLDLESILHAIDEDAEPEPKHISIHWPPHGVECRDLLGTDDTLDTRNEPG